MFTFYQKLTAHTHNCTSAQISVRALVRGIDFPVTVNCSAIREVELHVQIAAITHKHTHRKIKSLSTETHWLVTQEIVSAQRDCGKRERKLIWGLMKRRQLQTNTRTERTPCWMSEHQLFVKLFVLSLSLRLHILKRQFRHLD